MYQVTFSDPSINELNKMDKLEQMELMDALSKVNESQLTRQSDALKPFQRDGKTFFRLRCGDLRIYFEILEDHILFCHYILPQHTLTDFVFRFKLPLSEEQMLEQHHSFWKYLESLTK